MRDINGVHNVIMLSAHYEHVMCILCAP